MKGLLRLAFLSIAVLLAQGTWALAGVTGTLNGTVLLSTTNAPIAQAKVTASSPSQTSTSTTDNGGHFTFVSLVPDTYTVTANKENVIQETVQHGITVVADQIVTLNILARPAIKTIGNVVVRAGATELVRPGTTANVYSVNSAAQSRATTMGGGGSSDQGYSALAALPGAFIPPGSSGWYQNVFIRGGDFDQVGYEFDGVPVNRSFDNYPTTNLSAIGQQELQLYTGGAPASAESSGLAGYINQVIKSGTYPGYGTVTFGIGSPYFYNKASVEIGGATPNRNFSYYIGLGIVDSRPQYYDKTNGASIATQYGNPFEQICPPGTNGSGCFPTAPGGGGVCDATANPAAVNFATCYANLANVVDGTPVGPGGYAMVNYAYSNAAQLVDHENVFNFHIGIPHSHDSGKDDIQLLYDAFLLNTYYNSSENDAGGPAFYQQIWQNTSYNNTGGPMLAGFLGYGCGASATFPNCTTQPYLWARQSTIPIGTLVTTASNPCPAPAPCSAIVNYSYPSQGDAGQGGEQPLATRDTSDNGQGIYKLQWQRNISTSSYLRLYGYIYYSWWFLHGPQTGDCDVCIESSAPDYELWTHTRGVSASYVNQLSAHHLINIEGSYSTASTVRDNNTQMFQPVSGSRRRFGFLVDAANPTNGLCYSPNNPGVPESCEPTTGGAGVGGFGRGATLSLCGGGCGPGTGVQGGGIPDPNLVPGVCPSGSCAWLLAENGLRATYNTVTPRFWAVTAQDTWKPTDALSVNLGLREDIFIFGFTPTQGPARNFWLNAWNQTACVSPNFNGGHPFDETAGLAGVAAVAAGTPCTAVAGPGGTFPFVNATMTDPTMNGGSVTYTELQPRAAATYTVNPNFVLRASYGRYTQPANAAFQQYNTLQQNLYNFIGPLFYGFGFTTPNHTVRPSISNNYDLSFEYRFPNTTTSFTLTPFLRNTQGQQQLLFIDPHQNFVSGLNVGNETNTGAEFLLNAGNFNANGFAAQFAYTYTHSYIRYNALPNGVSVFAGLNSDIQQYNSFTSACVGAASSTTGPCGLFGGANAFPCFDGGVGTVACGTATAVSNPYFQAPVQSLVSDKNNYAPYDLIPTGNQLSSISYVVPNVAALIVQYKRDKWSFIPTFQFHSGQKYGSVETTAGFDPATCTPLAGGAIATDPRYPAGSVGNPADAMSCTGSLPAIPDVYTHQFDGIGAFTEPSQFSAGFTIGYDASSRVSYQLNLLNIVNTCWGGTSAAWTTAAQANGGNHWCVYGANPSFIPAVGNFYNPGANLAQGYWTYPYYPGQTYNTTLGVTSPFNATFNVQIKI